MSRITTGWLARHTPQGPGGRNAALIDVAQDLLLAHLHEQATFEHLVLKGGTALRKLYAGNAGRFSTDLDFSVRDPADDPTVVSDLLRGEIDGLENDGFHYHVDDHRRRPQVTYDTPFGGVGNLTTKLDIGPTPWLPPDERGWIRLAIHDAYNLPTALPVMALTENMAERSPASPGAHPPAMSTTWYGSQPTAPTRPSTAPQCVAWPYSRTGSTSTVWPRHQRSGPQSPARPPTTPHSGANPGQPQTSTNKASAYSPCHHPA